MLIDVWTVPSTDSDCLMCGLSAIDPLDKTTDHYADWFVWSVPSTDSDCRILFFCSTLIQKTTVH